MPVSRFSPLGRLVSIACVGLAVTGGAWGAVPEDSRSVSRGVSLERLRGKPLVDVLALLRQAGLNIVYSSGLVSPSLIVEREPTSSEPREILDELLPSFGLIALEGPAGAILIVRAGEIRGAVLSQETGLPIAGALVRVEHGPGAALSAVSGSDGSFRIGGIAPGSYDVWAQAQGFSEQDARDVRVSSGQSTSLTFRMSRPTYASELTVMPSKLSVLQDEPAARIIVSDDDVVNVPAFGGDVSRVVELLPGVAAGDNTAAFNVRGSESRDVMLLLDGLELYEPFHLRTLQSPFSLIDAKLVERLDLLSGGFTAEYGDRQGAVVDLTTPYLTSHRRMAVELGSINSRFLHHRPFAAGRGTWLVSARTWYPEKFRDTIQLGEDDLEPRFSDLYGKVSTAFGDRMLGSAHVLLTRDRVDYASREDNERIRVANRGVYFWLSAVNQWTAALSSQSVASIGKLEWERQGVSEPEAEQIDVDDERNVTFYGLKQDWTWEPLRAHRFKAGADVRWLSSDYSYASSSTGSTGPEFESRQVFLEPQGTTVGLYVADRVRFGPALAVELGLRYDAQNYTDDHQLSPRVNAVWHASDRRTFRFGWGRFYQSQRIHELRVEDGETSFLPAQLSHQAVLTYDERLPGGLVLRVDAYVKKLSRVRPRYENLFNPIELFPETEPDRIRIAPDRGRAEGLELLLRSARGRPLVWWASYSLSSVDDELNGESIPRRWDQTHAVHFLIGYEINERWSVSVSGSAHSGWPTTPVAGELREQPDGSLTAERVLGQLNSDRFPDYFRLDAKLRGDFLRKSSTLGLEIEILNLLDRQNVCCVDEFGLEPQPDGTVTVFRTVDPWLGITPSLRLSWEF